MRYLLIGLVLIATIITWTVHAQAPPPPVTTVVFSSLLTIQQQADVQSVQGVTADVFFNRVLANTLQQAARNRLLAADSPAYEALSPSAQQGAITAFQNAVTSLKGQ